MWMPPRSISRRTDRRTDGVTDSPKTPVEAQYSLCIVDSLKVTGAKGDRGNRGMCPGTHKGTGAHAPVAPVESAPMITTQTLVGSING